MFQSRPGEQCSDKTAADKMLQYYNDMTNPRTNTPLLVKKQEFKPHPSETMLASEWHGSHSVRVANRPRPMITEPNDAVIAITSTCICGSDLHFYNHVVPGVNVMHDGDIIGHEGMGIVKEVGSNVKNIKVGDRVVISAIIACGQCAYCDKRQFSLCDKTNQSAQLEQLYGHRLSGVFGYSHLTGGYAGLQCEQARVPFADVNLLKVPDNLRDEQVILLSDVMATAWHALRLAEVTIDDTVVIWGCGPIGLMAGYLAKTVIKCGRVINVDNVPYRLAVAQRNGCETINFDEVDVIKRVQELIPGGPDVCVDCVGFRFPKTLGQKIAYKMGMETDAIDVIKEAITLVKKGGRISLIGDYFGTCNGFPIGALMEKSITIRGGQLFAQKYWPELLPKIQSGEINSDWLFSHKLRLEEVSRGYQVFNDHAENCTKVLMKTKFGLEREKAMGVGNSLKNSTYDEHMMKNNIIEYERKEPEPSVSDKLSNLVSATKEKAEELATSIKSTVSNVSKSIDEQIHPPTQTATLAKPVTGPLPVSIAESKPLVSDASLSANESKLASASPLPSPDVLTIHYPVPAAPVQAAPIQAAPVQAAPVQAAPVQAAPVTKITTTKTTTTLASVPVVAATPVLATNATAPVVSSVSTTAASAPLSPAERNRLAVLKELGLKQ